MSGSLSGLLGTSIPLALMITILLESFGVPLPGESALIAAAAAAGAGQTSALWVFLGAWSGAVIGDNIGYLVGRRYGRRLIQRYGDRLGLTEARFDRVEAVTRKYGALMVLGARFVVVFRQFNGIVAGSSGMPWVRFLIANIVGAAAWAGLWVTVGDRLSHWLTTHPNLLHFVPLLAILVIAVMIALRLLHRARARRGAPPGPER